MTRPPRPAPRAGTWPRALVLCLCATAAAARLSFAQCPDGTPPPCAGSRPVAVRPAASSVAVLSFNARDTADTFLAEGLSEDVGTLLGGMNGVQVKPSTVVHRIQRSAGGDYARMAQLMAVRFLVDGSLRRVESHVRLSLQVIDAQRGLTVTMGKLYDAVAESLPGMAGAIAADVSAHVGGLASGGVGSAGRLAAGGAGAGAGGGGGPKKNSGPAYEHFLRGNFLLAERTPSSIVQAYAEYREAERLDAHNPAATARAAYALALALNFEVPVPGMPAESLVTRGLVAADRALRADSTLSDAWMAKGYLLSFADPRTLRGAPEAFERAITLDPRNAEAHHQYAFILNELGDSAAARRELERALELEPARAISLVDLAATTQRDATHALQLLDSAIVLSPGMALAYRIRGQVHAQMRHGPQALADAEAAVRMSTAGSEGDQSLLVRALTLVGDTARARTVAQRWRTPVARGAFGAEAMLALGDSAAALELLERVPGPSRDARLWRYLRYPQFDAVRANPRFQRVYADSRPPGARSP